jgi:hypothetical protein
MRVTESAANAIVHVMSSKKLPPEEWSLEICTLENGALGMGFTQEKKGHVVEFGDLSVVVADNVNSEGVVVDFGEVEGKQGLVFLSEEEYVNNQTNGESGEGSQESDGRTEDGTV